MCITVENTYHGLFLDMSDVQELLATESPSDHTQWRVARVDYCKLRDPAVDPPTSQKPTVFITYGYDFINAQCSPGNRCGLMLADGIHHQYCIRNNPDQPAEQVRIEDPLLRSRIPRGVYRHFRTKRSQLDQSQSAVDSASIAACEEFTCDMECEEAEDYCEAEYEEISICEMESATPTTSAEPSDSKLESKSSNEARRLGPAGILSRPKQYVSSRMRHQQSGLSRGRLLPLQTVPNAQPCRCFRGCSFAH